MIFDLVAAAALLVLLVDAAYLVRVRFWVVGIKA